MNLKFLLFAALLFFSSSFSSEHPLKMSFSKLVINENGSIELETRIFLDDLTEHLQNLYSIEFIDFSTPSSNGCQALGRYLAQNFYFEQDGNNINLWINAVSLSNNKLALVVNLSTLKPIDANKELYLVNTLLCDAAPTQINDIRYLNKHYQLGVNNPKTKLISVDIK